MMIREYSKAKASEPKVLKVNIPAEITVRLHTLKIMTGKSISTIINEALEAYFDTLGPRLRGPPPGGDGA